ncbi:hypothetical protein PO909_005755 [Leuciscus waleckii]
MEMFNSCLIPCHHLVCRIPWTKAASEIGDSLESVIRVALRSEKVLQQTSSLYKLDKLMTLDSVILKIYPEEKMALRSTMKRQGAAAVKVEQ